jgi:type I restriction enzyme S subunit
MMAEQAKVPAIRFAGFTDPWEQRKLGDVASSFDYGLNAAATEYDGQNKYLRITDIDDETHEFSKSDLTTPLADLAMSADYLLKEGDLLFARTGASVGKTYLYRQFDGMVYFAGFLIRARIGEGADPEFAYQATLTDAYKKYVAITSQRSGQPGVNAQEYADYQLMLPSKTEQQQIGMTLRSLDDLITLHQRKYDKLVIFKKSMLEKMFPKDGESVPEIRFAGFTDPWEQRELVDIAEIVGGGTPDTNNSNYWDGDIDWYAPAELGNNIYAESSTRKITQAGFDSCSTKMLPADKTILFTSRAGIGNTAILRHSACTNQGFQSLVIGDADVYFVYSMSERIKKWAEEKASGSTFLEISGRQLETMPVNLPSLVEQQAIGSFFSHLDDLITLHQRKLELLQNIKKSLLDKMFV